MLTPPDDADGRGGVLVPGVRTEAMDGDVLGEARGKLTATLQAFSVARTTLPAVQAALAAGRAPSLNDLAGLANLDSALAEAANALGVDRERATLADLQAELAAREKAVDLRGALGRLGRATGPGVTAPELASLATEATRLGGTATWSPADRANAVTLARLVELADVARDGDEERILSLDAELRQALGPRADAVVLAAARGRLVLPSAPHPAAPQPIPARKAPAVPARSPAPPRPKSPQPLPTSTRPGQSRTETATSILPHPDPAAGLPAASASPEVIRTEALTKVYPGMDVPAVDRLDLSVCHGEIFGLLGPNGAGKTTTAGMLTTRVIPTSGSAVVGGIDVVAHPALAKQAIGVVPQQNTLDRALSVWENLYFHGRFFGMSRKASHEAADELLQKFHLSKWGKASVFALSGGMAQRLMVARAILHRPRILFLDEPTAGLDPQSRLALWEILMELHKEGQTILLTTHYMEEADQLCDRVAIMDHGKVLALDTPAALKASLGAETIVTVTAEGDLTALAGLLCRDVDGVTDSRQVEGAVVLHVKGASGVLPQVVTAAERGGFVVRDLSVAEPTLETVFIHLTGKELRD